MSTTPPPRGHVGVIDPPLTYADLALVIDDRAIWTAFQPIVRLDTREIVGYEALSRGPAGTRWQDPLAMFAAARAIGRAGELDWICRARAHQGAAAAGLDPALLLFVNVEPSTLREPCPPDLLPAFMRTHKRLMMEFTERDLAADPAALLVAAAGHRAAGHGVALDDVGAEAASLALMPFVHPDIVKLDMRLLHHPEAPQTAQVVNAVIAHAERTGALILAEGIERDAHLARARSMGATLGQGWLLGRPGPLSTVGPYQAKPHVRPLGLLAPAADRDGATRTPFEIVCGGRPAACASKQALLTTTRYLESKAADTADPPVLLATFQRAAHFTPATAHRYSTLAKESPFVAAFGGGFGTEPVPGVRGGALAGDDPLRNEWNVVVVGPYFSAALVARDLGDSGADRHRRFEYALTYERPLALAAARALLARLEPRRAVT
jgi:EAL domain-containing protein (putative c-di-GMP-specific phosphodiesterase class I)